MKVAIDSDMLRDLVFFERLTKGGVVFKYKNPWNIDNSTVRKFLDEFTYLYNAVVNNQIELHVSKYVYNEVKHDEYVVAFVEKYCHRNPKVDEAKIEELAHAYSNMIVINGEQELPPINRCYVAAIDKYVPTNDSYIMADATVNRLGLLTNNVCDFIFDKASPDKENHRRIDGIIFINRKFGYKKSGIDGDYIPQPIVIKKLVKYLKNVHDRKINLVSKTYTEKKKTKQNSPTPDTIEDEEKINYEKPGCGTPFTK